VTHLTQLKEGQQASFTFTGIVTASSPSGGSVIVSLDGTGREIILYSTDRVEVSEIVPDEPTGYGAVIGIDDTIFARVNVGSKPWAGRGVWLSWNELLKFGIPRVLSEGTFRDTESVS
jgi:hypothetical protein